MKNYYEILEVNKNASPEVIEKAYKILAKKYHPDLQEERNKQGAAEKMKLLNEAYEVLSDKTKKAQYDEELDRQQRIKEMQEHQKIMQENNALREELNRMENQGFNQQVYQQMGNQNVKQQNYQQMDQGTILNMNRVLSEQINAARQKAYHDAYIQELKNRGYKIRYKRDLKYYIKFVFALAVSILLCYGIYQIPFVKNYFQAMYNENVIFQSIVDVIKNTFFTSF